VGFAVKRTRAIPKVKEQLNLIQSNPSLSPFTANPAQPQDISTEFEKE
jgi:hypothetical protein